MLKGERFFISQLLFGHLNNSYVLLVCTTCNITRLLFFKTPCAANAEACKKRNCNCAAFTVSPTLFSPAWSDVQLLWSIVCFTWLLGIFKFRPCNRTQVKVTNVELFIDVILISKKKVWCCFVTEGKTLSPRVSSVLVTYTIWACVFHFWWKVSDPLCTVVSNTWWLGAFWGAKTLMGVSDCLFCPDRL